MFYSQKKHNSKKGSYVYINPECKVCTKKRSTEWRKKDENRKSFLESQKKRNKKFVIKIRENGKRRRLNGDHKEWMKNNKEKLKEYSKKRRLVKTHDITEEEWEECKTFFNYSCGYCGIHEDQAKIIFNNNLHKEHVDPSGNNKIHNCIPACKSCNSNKWKYSLEEWYNPENKIYSVDRYNKVIEWLQRSQLKEQTQ